MAEIALDELTTVNELEDALADSVNKIQLIFKHSLTCPISARAYEEFMRHLNGSASAEVEYRLIIVQHARNVSNAAAEQLVVKHESPQAILVRDGRAVWHASHFSITSSSLDEAIRSNL
jgi:bacillithiol system protein YtxJ